MDIEKLDLSVRTYNAFKRAGVNTVDDYFRIGEEPLKRLVGEKSFEEFIRAVKCIAPVPQEASEISETFNYAVLSAELGDYLRQKEEQLKNEYMSFTANCGRIFAEAQEKLAKNGFGEDNGIFRKWISSMGFAKSTVYRMIDIYKFRLSQIGTDEGKQFFDALPKTLQADISAPSAPPELVEQVMSGDVTTHKEYIALKKELESQKQMYSKVHDENQELRRDRVNALNRADNAERELSDAKAEIEKLSREADEADREYDAMADRECHYETEICELKHQIKELESRPRDVAVQSDPEDAKRIAELEEEIKNLRSKPNELDFGDDDGVSADKLSEFYEMLHGKVLAALKDCKAFVLSDDLPQIVKDRAVGRFGTLKDLITMYIEDMEE